MASSVRTEVLSNGKIRYCRAGCDPEIWHRGKEPLGQGGQGKVWHETLVSGPSRPNVRALKQMLKSEDTSQQLQRELKILLTFCDGAVPEFRECFVGCYGSFEDTSSIYIAMEYLPHGDLGRHISTRPCSEGETALITAQIAQALQYMHSKDVVHRDLKPQNILVSRSGPEWHVKLADFGISKSMQGTILHTRLGTPEYMAPELHDFPLRYTAAVDIWSLGAVVFCVRTGQPPFRSAGQVLDYKHDKIRFPTKKLPSSTGECMDFILETMQKQPNQRPTIDQVLQHEWIRPSSNTETTRASSRTVTQADGWDKEASKERENNDVHSSQNTYGSRSTIRPFINEKPKRSSRTIPASLRTETGDQLGQNTMNPARPPENDSNSFVKRAPVQNAQSVPSRPATQQRQSHPQPAAPATYPSKVRDTIKMLFSRHSSRSPSAPSTSTAYRNDPSPRDYSSPPSGPPTSATYGYNQSLGEYPRSQTTLPTRHGDGFVRDTYGHKTIDPWLTCLTCKRTFESREYLFKHLLAQEKKGDGHARDIRTRRPERFVPEIFVFVR